MRFILILIFSLVFIGCKSEKVKRQLEQLSELENSFHNLQEQFQQIPMENYIAKLSENEQKVDYVQKHLQDTIDKNDAFLFGDFIRLRRNINKFQKAYEEQEKNINFARKQISALKTDVSNDLIDVGDFSDYLASENKSLAGISERIEHLVRWSANLEERYTTLDSFVNNFIQTHIDANYQP